MIVIRTEIGIETVLKYRLTCTEDAFKAAKLTPRIINNRYIISMNKRMWYSYSLDPMDCYLYLFTSKPGLGLVTVRREGRSKYKLLSDVNRKLRLIGNPGQNPDFFGYIPQPLLSRGSIIRLKT